MSKYNKNDSREFMRAFSVIGTIGITIVGCLGIAIAIGWFLDRWLGSSPWFLLVFTLIGIGAAFKSIFDFAKKM